PAALGSRALPLSSPTSLEAALAAAGYRLPPGAGVYAAKVTKEAGGLAYEDYQAGIGALGTAFWPASSIKVLAAVAALEYVGQQGFTGDATVAFGNGTPRTIRSIYDAAIRVSDNAAYDLLVEIAGLDYLNGTFLTPARGFPATVIQRSYTVGGNLRTNPALTLTEGGRKVVVPARTGKVDASCPQGQCSNLYEMSESVRRVVLHNEIPEAERFKLAPPDVVGINSALLAAEGWFEPAVARVLGAGARIFGKPGQVPGRDCLDVVLIEARNNQRILLSATVPERQGGCPALVTLAQNVLQVLKTG
ncbi:MAG TPA: serine hydrolase, partial [Acidimicrobiales bacterium]|nr:serine hydrolase [Acidimicrobiales bacterium]